MVYLDHAATTPVPAAVADEMYTVLRAQFGNPSAQYPMGLEMKRRVESWRSVVAGALGCQPGELYFTSCGTEGDAWAIHAACWQNRRVGKHIVTTAVEHSAVLESCRWMAQEGWEVTYVAPEPGTGRISAQAVLDAVRPDTALVSCMLVNNELGCVYPIAEIARGLSAKNPKTLLHTDAVQGFLKVPFTPKSLGADFVTISAHKIGGPKGIGALYMGPRVRNPRPLLPGGGQEGGARSGTEATAQIAGFAKAVELRLSFLKEHPHHLEEIRDYAREKLAQLPDVLLIGQGDAPHILSLSMVGWPSQNMVNDLGSQGICISAGSACHKGKPSHVYAALKLPKPQLDGILRISFSYDTAREDVDALVQGLKEAQAQLFTSLS